MQGSIIFIGVTLQCSAVVLGDYFSSFVALERLMETEKKLAETLTVYIQKEEERLASLKKHVEEIERLEWIKELSLETLYHPTSAYKFLKKSVYEFPSLDVIKNLTVNSNTSTDLSKLLKNIHHHPNEEDIVGASKAIFRLLDVYELKIDRLIEGNIGGKMGSPLSVQDSCDLGYTAVNLTDYYHAVVWFVKCWLTAKKYENNVLNLTRFYDNVGVSFYYQENYERAEYINRKLKHIDPDYVGLYDSLERKELSAEWDGTVGTLPPLNNVGIVEDPDYEELCRGNTPINETMRKDLSCYYKNDRDFLRYAPIKVELLHRDPHIYLFKQVVSDKEIHTLKEITKSMMERAKIGAERLSDKDRKGDDPIEKGAKNQTDETEIFQKPQVSDYRVAQNAWLKEKDDPVVEIINRRAEYMTNLDLKFAEHLQIANYGVGGHYVPHYDAFFVHASPNQSRPDVFNQPEMGGSTVFTRLNVSVPATKNDALFWYNLHLNGEVDMDTEHAGCPVLYGGKWVANKWIPEGGNEFTRPCGLNKDDKS